MTDQTWYNNSSAQEKKQEKYGECDELIAMRNMGLYKVANLCKQHTVAKGTCVYDIDNKTSHKFRNTEDCRLTVL